MSYRIKKIINFLVNPLLIGIVFTIYLSIITKSEFPLYIITFIYLIWLLANKKIISKIHWCLLVVLFLPITPKILYSLFLAPYLINFWKNIKSSSLFEDWVFRIIKDLLKRTFFALIHLFVILWLSQYIPPSIVKGLFIIIGFIICAIFIRLLFQLSFSICYVTILEKTPFYLELSKLLKFKKSTILVFHVLAIVISILFFIIIFAVIYYYWFKTFYNFNVDFFDFVYFTFCVYYSVPMLSDTLETLLTTINNDSVLRIFQITHIITGKIVDLTILGFIIISLTEKLKELMDFNNKSKNKGD